MSVEDILPNGWKQGVDKKDETRLVRDLHISEVKHARAVTVTPVWHDSFHI